MHIKVHKLNTDFIHQEAEKIRQNDASSGSGSKDLEFYQWKVGENNLRLLPPYNAKGLLFKFVQTHFKLPPDNKMYRCMHMWEDKYDTCFICDALDKLKMQFPETNLSRQEASYEYYANVIDRDDEEKGVQICKFTTKIRNWIMTQIDNRKIGDISDYEQGFDLVITKVVKKTKGEDRTEYTAGLVPRPCPLHEKDELVAKWLGDVVDLDRVYSPYTDDTLAGVKACANKVVNYYHRKYRSDESFSSSSIDTTDDVDPTVDDVPEPTKRGAKPVEEDKHEDPPVQPDTPSPTLDGVDPRSVPTCFAGLANPEPNDDGSIGYNEDLEKCFLLCPEEFRCMEAKNKKGMK